MLRVDWDSEPSHNNLKTSRASLIDTVFPETGEAIVDMFVDVLAQCNEW